MIRGKPTRIAALALGLAVGAATTGRAIEIDQLFETLDANRDGLVTGGEIDPAHRRLFERMLRVADDGDGALAFEEFAAALQPLRAAKPAIRKHGSRIPGSEALLVLLSRMDANGDRRLLEHEIPPALASLFHQMRSVADSDKNRRLDTMEVTQASPRLARMAAQAARRLGLDVPGEYASLSPVERTAFDRGARQPVDSLGAPANARRLFDRLDSDGEMKRQNRPDGTAAKTHDPPAPSTTPGGGLP